VEFWPAGQLLSLFSLLSVFVAGGLTMLAASSLSRRIDELERSTDNQSRQYRLAGRTAGGG
jgi:hypothetical protein